jgi:hypothetical protein
MKISDIIERRKGTAGAWRVKTTDNGRELWHYTTRMLVWHDTPHGTELVEHSIGWGSVSDQNGMNTAFRTLNLPYTYKRAGGARIEPIT